MTGWATTALLSIVLALIALIDFRHYRVPDLLSLPLMLAGMALAWIDGPEALRDRVLGAAVGFGVLAAFGEAYFRLRGFEGLGLGDAKLFGAAGAWLGWQALPLVLLLAAGSGLCVALVTGVRGRAERIAFGPWIAFGFLLAWLVGPDRQALF